ncbi:MAG: glycosyltransferase family 2 protein [Syntrophorhabdales bacterium]
MISVILPTYNEAENVRAIVPSIVRELDKAGLQGEVVVVDDDSPDGTAGVAQDLAGSYPVRVHVRKDQRGLATAVMKGFEIASGEVCVVMDADLSHPVEKIPDMVRPILEKRCTATVGSRYTAGGGCENWPFVRRLVSRGSGLLARGLSPLTDPSSGFMAVRRDALDGIALNPVGWKIVLEVVVKTGARIAEVPIVFQDRQKGASKLDARVEFQYLAHLWRLYCFRYPGTFEFLKFCLVGFFGLLVDTSVLIGAVQLAHLDPRAAAVPAFLCAVTVNYAVNRRWTFAAGKESAIATSYGRFVAVCLAGLLLRLGTMHVLIAGAGMGVGYRYVLASFIGIAVATMFNFLGSKFVAFSGRGGPQGR